MFGTNTAEGKKEGAAKKMEYKVIVKAARQTKNDSIIMFDMNVNGVEISSCMLKEETVKKDGKKYKAGDTCYFINFPNYKSDNGKYYNHVWFPVSDEVLQNVIDQIKKILAN